MVLKEGGDIPAFQKALDRAVGARAKIDALVSRRSLEIRDLDKTVEKEEEIAALAGALGRPDLDGHCRLDTRFGGVRTAVAQLVDADASRLLQLGKVRVGCVNCRIREHAEVVRCFMCHVSRGCTHPSRKDACWRCGDLTHRAKECKAPEVPDLH